MKTAVGENKEKEGQLFSGDESNKEETVMYAVPVLVPVTGHRFEFDEDALKSILLKDEFKDRLAVVVSVAGAFRKGKSFLLDFFLRYLKAEYSCGERVEDWMGDPEEPLEGFSWKGGSERDTAGILIWHQVFTTTLSNGEEVAIILLDTQGAFDSDSTVRDSATVFALSTMVSSIQIYNLSQNIQEDDLQHLELFTEFGRLALADTGHKPFQKLQFLVRDWSYSYDHALGANGGQTLLDKRLQIKESQHEELQTVRKHIHSCFSDISCFLLPHPGLKVAVNPKFDGKLSDIEDDFKAHLKVLVPLLLGKDGLIVKEIAGHKVRVKELVQYFRSYATVYSGDELPEPRTMVAATAEANNLAAVAAAKETYSKTMDEICGGNTPYLSPSELHSEHSRIKAQVVDQFTNKRKMGGKEFSNIYRLQLESDLEELYIQLTHCNESKNVFKSVRTPSVFLALALISYVFSGLLGFVGLYTFANWFHFLMGLFMTAIITWSYTNYTGEMGVVKDVLDQGATTILENYMIPFSLAVSEHGLRAVLNRANDAAFEVENLGANEKEKTL